MIGSCNASINSSCVHAPLGNHRAFAHIVSPGVGHSQILLQPGGWALAYPRATPGHLTHVLSKDGWVYWEGCGLCQSQSFPPKKSNKCINLRAMHYIMFILNEECSHSRKAENCSFVQKRRNFVTRLLVVYIVTGHYKVTFLYENLSMSTCMWLVRNTFFGLIKIHDLKVLASFKSVLYPGFVLTSFLWINKVILKFLPHANKTLNKFTTKIRTFGRRATKCAYFYTIVVFVVWTFITWSSHFCGWKGSALLRAFDTV